MKAIARVAMAYADAGAHVLAPSDMMDCRIGAIKQELLVRRPLSPGYLTVTQ